MSDYDFKPLNDKEFEILCADLLGEERTQRFERFKAGKDSGVDGRYFTNTGDEVVLQCKHWSNTPVKQLVYALTTIEKPKLQKLKPSRYLLAVSNQLSRADKKAISHALNPYIKSENDIYGKEDLNDLLKKHPLIERKHYKLWLHSTTVLGHMLNNAILGRSEFSIEEIIQNSARYVVTTNHEKALRTLENLGIIIVTGEPGIGKTTLANHLCLHYVSDGYTYIKIADDIREAETIFDRDTKQIFYFDDFLGRNYLDALKGHEGSHVVHFINRVARNKNKRFVLTSRSTILNQGKVLIDSLEHGNVRKNEYELKITSLTEMDKAQILYNHIWHSGLKSEYIEQLYLDKRYKSIIKHRNYNPRLISYITDETRLDFCTPDNYWEYIMQSLTNPSQVWDNPFVAQQDDFGRTLVLLVVINGHPINESMLGDAYYKYLSLPENQNLQGRREFQANIRQLTGSFLNRIVAAGSSTKIDLFNPSIGDYVLQRYAEDTSTIRLAMLSLQNQQCIITLRSLKLNNRISQHQAFTICNALINDAMQLAFKRTNVVYLSSLCKHYHDWAPSGQPFSDGWRDAIRHIYSEGIGLATDDSFEAIRYGMEQKVLTEDDALNFATNNIEAVKSTADIESCMSLMSSILPLTTGYQDTEKAIAEHIIELLKDDISEFIDLADILPNVEYGDYASAERKIKDAVEERLNELGIKPAERQLTFILGGLDVAYELDNYYLNCDEGSDKQSNTPQVLAIDEIDDLFDRG